MLIFARKIESYGNKEEFDGEKRLQPRAISVFPFPINRPFKQGSTLLANFFQIISKRTMTAKEIIAYMESLQNEEQRRILMGFFKTGPGEYGEGDEFLGLKVPQTREVVKNAWKDFPLSEVLKLLMSKWHEVRLCGLLILVAKFEKLATKRLENDEKAIRGRDEILTMYLKYAEQANNWDLVDLSVHKILGHWLLLPSNLGDRDYKLKVLDDLAQSPCLWKQRMSMVCSWKTSQMGDPSWCLRYAEIHLHHPHDLMHKAVGWMLREMGKRVSMDLLRDFLRQHVHEMPRTTLRYAIEKMSEEERQTWMKMPEAHNFQKNVAKTIEI
jgi:3-methyladenine DNA glycosylase AlkD